MRVAEVQTNCIINKNHRAVLKFCCKRMKQQQWIKELIEMKSSKIIFLDFENNKDKVSAWNLKDVWGNTLKTYGGVYKTNYLCDFCQTFFLFLHTMVKVFTIFVYLALFQFFSSLSSPKKKTFIFIKL